MSINDDRLQELGLTSPQMAKGQAIGHLSRPKDEALKTLSVITAKDLPRLNFLDALYDACGYNFVKKSVDNESLRRSSMNRKGVRGRDDLVKVSIDNEQKQGALASFKENIKSFFSSGV